MASALLRGRSSTTSRTMPRYTSSLTDLSRNGEIPMMNLDGDSLLTPWPAAPESGGEKLSAQRPTTATSNFSLPTFFPATGYAFSVEAGILPAVVLGILPGGMG